MEAEIWRKPSGCSQPICRPRGVSYLPHLHRVSKNVPPLACYNFDAHEWICDIFGVNVRPTDNVGNHKTLYYATSNNLCFSTTCQNGKARKAHVSLNWIVLHTNSAPVRCLPERTSSSAIAEGPRDALSQLKSCQLLHNCTTNHI